MKASEIQVNKVYKAKISGKIVPVRVLTIEKHEGHRVGSLHIKAKTVYHVLNLLTNRQTTFKSASRFRSEVTQ